MKIDERLVRDIIKHHEVKIRRESDYQGSRRLELERCPFDESHTNSAALFLNGDKCGFKCQHDSCSNRNIIDFVAFYEPQMLTKARGQKSPEPIKMQCLADVEEETAEWLIKGYIPKGTITLLSGDGGVGKSLVWADIVASVTTGKNCMLNHASKEEREPKKAMFFSSEDSVSKVLVGRLKRAGADLNNIVYLDANDDAFKSIHFNSEELRNLIEEHRPALCVFDPLQSFIPPDLQMCSRNAMRQCLSPLLGLGDAFGTTFLIVCHTNKKIGVYGRQRVADSSDIWDISRSVLIVGKAEEELRYLSQEKSSYDKLSSTVLFSVDDFGVRFEKYSSKHDVDFVQEAARVARPSPARDEAKDMILTLLKDGELAVRTLDETLARAGVSTGTLKRAKQELAKEGKIKTRAEGYGNNKAFFIGLEEWQDAEDTPFLRE